MGRLLSRCFKLTWMGLAICFAVYYFISHFHVVKKTISSIPISSIVLLIIFIFLAKIFLVFNMSVSLRRVKITFYFGKCFKVYSITQIAKYIPGSIWQFVGRINIYKESGMTAEMIRDSILFETTGCLFGAIATGVILLLMTNTQMLVMAYQFVGNGFFLWVILILIILVWTGVRGRWLRGMILLIKRYSPNPACMALQIFIWLFFGLGFGVSVWPFIDRSCPFFYLIGLYGIAYAVGFIVPFAPAGLGIREGVLILGLSGYLPAELVAVLAVFNRFIIIVMEMLMVAVLVLPYFNRR